MTRPGTTSVDTATAKGRLDPGVHRDDDAVLVGPGLSPPYGPSSRCTPESSLTRHECNVELPTQSTTIVEFASCGRIPRGSDFLPAAVHSLPPDTSIAVNKLMSAGSMAAFPCLRHGYCLFFGKVEGCWLLSEYSYRQTKVSLS